MVISNARLRKIAEQTLTEASAMEDGPEKDRLILTGRAMLMNADESEARTFLMSEEPMENSPFFDRAMVD